MCATCVSVINLCGLSSMKFFSEKLVLVCKYVLQKFVLQYFSVNLIVYNYIYQFLYYFIKYTLICARQFYCTLHCSYNLLSSNSISVMLVNHPLASITGNKF